SRLLFYLEHWAVVRFGTTTGIPPNVVMAFVKIAMVFLVVTMAMLTVDQYRRASGGKPTDLHWRRLYGLVAVLAGVSLVLYNPASHPLTLFPGLYLGTTALTLGIPLWFGRSWLRYRAGEPLRQMWIRVGSAVIIGALLASMIELTYLVIPLGLLHLILLSFASGDSWSAAWLDLFHSEAFLLWAMVVTGFLVVFIPARTAINQYCADAACYRGAEMSLGGAALETFPLRVGASFFPIPQWTQIHLLKELRAVPGYLFLGFAAGGFAYYLLRRSAFERENDERGRAPRLPMLLMGVYFAAVVFFAGWLAAISGAVQDKGWDISPWRETGFTWIGWVVIIAVALTAFFDWLRDDPGVVVALAAIIAVLAFMTTIVNQADMGNINSQLDTRLLNEAGLLLVHFDDTEEGNNQRCGVIADLRAFAPDDSELRKMTRLGSYLDSAADNIYGVVFCDSGSS
ncbi:MAG: hypothetical protein QNJ89_12535, partial [Acidimicrobiia bacterium]|nr:hypothetical protein [Acidimicrobiia bacterium]